MSAPAVTVVLPLEADADGALRALAALAEVPDEPAHEVVVVDDGAGGALDALLARIDGDAVVVRHERPRGLAAAWCSGAARASGGVLILLAAGAEVAPGFLAPLAAALEHPAVAVATAGAGEAVATAAVAARRGDLRRAWAPGIAAVGAGPGPGGPGAPDAEAGTPTGAAAGTAAALDAPAVPDALAAAALVARLAGVGEVRTVPASQVTAPAGAGSGTAPPARDAAGRGLDRHPPGTAPELTVVIPTLDAAGDRLRRCVRAVQDATDAPYEIVVVDNGAPPQGFTAPVNAGIRAARGRHVVVLNDDVEVLPGWWPPLREALDAGAAVAFPWTVGGAMREDFAAWCFAVSADARERFAVADGEFLRPDLVVWFQDTDLLLRLRAAGEPPVLVRDSRVRHGLSETVATDDPALRAWIDGRIERDRATFAALHGAAVAA